jgi:hypothetical protein
MWQRAIDQNKYLLKPPRLRAIPYSLLASGEWPAGAANFLQLTLLPGAPVIAQEINEITAANGSHLLFGSRFVGPVDALKKLGGNIRFTILPGRDHDIWIDIYSDPAFYEWLLQHKKP